MAAKTASLSVNIIADAAKARAGLKEAETAFGKFRREVGEAQGAMGKFQTISGSAFNYVKANAVAFATSAAAAIGAFAVKSVRDFQDLALAAGKFGDATGLTSEQASRFIEVAGDVGVEAGTIEKALGFMNKTLGNSPQLFEKLGVEISRTSSGAADVNATFLNVVRRLGEIDDPAKRAAAATQLLGRGWMELSELVGMGADELSASLASVADSKVIDEEEVRKARDFRAAIDELTDRFEGFANQLGESVVPALTEVLKFVDLISGGDISGGALTRIADQFDDDNFINNVKAIKDEQNFLNEAWKQGYRAQIDARSASAQLQISMEQQAAAVEAARLEWDAFRTGLNIKAESIRLTQDIEDFRTKWAGTTEEAKRKSREYQLELIAIQTQLANSALAIVGLATTAQNTRIQLMIETGRLEQALSLIGAIRAGMNQLAGAVTPDRVERIVGQAPPPTTRTPGTTAPAPRPPSKSPVQQMSTIKPAASYGGPKVTTKRYAGLAAGGTLLSSGGVIVGEFGPELLNLPRGASVTPNIPQRMAGGGQTIINIQVQAGLVSSPDQVGAQIIDAIKRAERRSGQVFSGI
jgi:hypothetical protein